MKISILVIIFLVSLSIKLLNSNNKKKSATVKKKMQNRIEIANSIRAIKESSYNEHTIAKLLINLLEDYHLHEDIGKKLTDVQIKDLEKQISLTLPLSYKLFLQYFGNGGTWIYADSIDTVHEFSWFSKSKDTIEVVGGNEVTQNSLLFLMTEDSNGGSWCWLTSEKNEDGEWSLAYYNRQDNKLHYKINNFTEWLKILVASKGEVIRELDVDDKLGLG